MAEFTFDPPQHPLFGGGGYTWEPAGMAGATRGGGAFPAYHQPLGYDIYANAYQSQGGGLPFDRTPNAPSYGMFDPNRGFSAESPSVTSSQRSQNFRSWQESEQNRVSGIFTAPGPDLNAYRASDMQRGGAASVVANPFMGAGGGYGAAQMGASAPMGLPASTSAIVPYQGIGGTMGSAMYMGGGAQDDPRRLLEDFATSLREKLNPAMKESVDMLQRLPSRAGGGGAGGGISGGAGYGGGGGFGGGGDFIEGEFWEMPNRSGFGQRIGNFFRGLGSDVGNMLQNPDALSFNVWKASMAWRTFGGSALSAADAYQQQQASQEGLLLGSGISSYGDLMGGMYGDIARRRGRGAEFQYQYGQQASAAMSGLMDIFGGPSGGQGILGTIMALGGPAVGAGLAAGALSGGNPVVAAGAGLATFGAGLLGYTQTNMSNYYGIGRAANEYNPNLPLESLRNNPAGTIGAIGNLLSGTMGDIRYLNSGRFAQAVDRFAQGGIDVSELNVPGFSDSDTFGEGMNVMMGNLATQFGIQRDDPALSQFMRRFLRTSRRQLPTSSQVTNAFTVQSMGYDSVSMAQQRLSAFGGNQYNISQMGDMATSIESRIAGAFDPLSSAQTVVGETAIASMYNPLRSSAGLPLMSANEAQRMVGLSDYQRTNRLAAEVPIMSGMASGSEFYAQPGMSGFQEVMGRIAEAGSPQVAARMNSQLGRYESIYRRTGMYGGDQAAVMRRAFNAATMGEAASDADYAMQNGDQWALSQNWRQLGDIRYRTIDTETGLGINEMARRGLQDQQLSISRGLDAQQYAYQTANRNMGFQVQTAGAGIGAGGFAVGGDGLAGLASVFASQGLGFNAGNGMGMWQIQDAMTMLNRQQQQSSMDMAGASNDIAMRRFILNSNYQESNMNINRQHQITSFGWQEQNMAMDRNRAELSFGWQMEDFDRNIRYATGRQRLDLMRQQERATISFGMDQTQRNQAEQQFETQKEWAKDEFDRKKTYFEEGKKLTEEEMALQKTRYEENKRNMQEVWNLEDQRRLIDRQVEQAQYVMATNIATQSREAQVKLNGIADALLQISRIDTSNLAFIDTMVHQGTVGSSSGSVGTSSAGSGGVVPLPPPTNYPAPTHGGGRTVPTQNIAARGGSDSGLTPYLMQMVKLLEMIASYGPMRMNATVYSNTDVKTSDLYNQAKARTN